MVEIDDYNAEQFFAAQDNWEEYQSLMEDWEEPAPQEKDSSYLIFTIEQATNAIEELAKQFNSLRVPVNNAADALQELMDKYTKVVE